jgi:peptide/nickel transport system permease protein
MSLTDAALIGGESSVSPRRHQFRKFVLWLCVLALTLLGLLLVTFVIGRVLPVDPAVAIAGDRALPEVYDAIRQRLHLNQPVFVQFWYYLLDALRGDLGESVLSSQPVTADIRRFFPATLELATAATIFGVAAGVPLGILAAVRNGRFTDHVIRLVALAGYSVPVFWLGLIGLIVFYARLDWVNGPGRIDIAYQYGIPDRTGLLLVDTLLAGNVDAFRNAFGHLILPALVLGYFSFAFICRITRSAMISELSQEYVVTARAKGLTFHRILWRHALANCAAPIVTTIFLSYAQLLEGAVLTETVFSWPGLGLYVTQSLFSADLNAVLGATLVIGVCFVLLNAMADLITPLLDPRSRQ